VPAPLRVRLFSPAEAAGARAAAEAALLAPAPPPGPARERWLRGHVWPDSPWLLRLSHGPAVRDDPACLVRVAAARLQSYGTLLEDPGYFFLRCAFPGQTRDGVTPLAGPVLSPGHYDAYGEPSLSVWVALQDTTPGTGTFWWGEGPELLAFYADRSNWVPRHYHARRTPAEDALHAGAVREYCAAGEALVFGPGLLHGSTAAASAPRLTYDFRLRPAAP
jgi:hypothetical protein